MKKQNKQDDFMNSDFIRNCARAFASDLLRYSENGGDMQNITAAKVYGLLEKLDRKDKLRTG